MKSFYTWISILTPAYEKIITHELVHRGYTVSAGAEDNKVLSANCLMYKLHHNEKALNQVQEDIINIIDVNKIYYHLLIVIEGLAHAVWSASDITFKTISKEEKEIEDVMTGINKLLGSYKDYPLTLEEKKRFTDKRKNG